MLRRGRQFVHETFGDKDIVRRPDAAPEGGRNAGRLHPQILDVHVRERVNEINRAFCGVGVETILERRREPSRKDRGARETIMPGDWHSFVIETSRHSVEEIGPIHVMLDIFLAGPHDLHGAVDLLRDLDGANDAIDLQPPAKSTADQMIVDRDLIQRQAQGLCRRRLSPRDDLAADPDFATLHANMDCAVHRLHCGVREKWNLVDRFDLRGGARHGPVDIADILRNCARIERRLFELTRDLSRVELGVRTVVPFDYQRCQSLPPVAVSALASRCVSSNAISDSTSNSNALAGPFSYVPNLVSSNLFL